MPLDMSPESLEATKFYRKIDAHIALMRMSKILAYAKQSGIDPKELTGAGIALRRSSRLTPGFRDFKP